VGRASSMAVASSTPGAHQSQRFSSTSSRFRPEQASPFWRSGWIRSTAQSRDHIGWPITPSATSAARRTAGPRSAASQIGISSRSGSGVGWSSAKSAR
jgi:hypothetical protein